MQAVQGPPTILEGQVVEGYANDPARQVSYQVRTFPSADSFYAVGLPAGMDLNQTTGVISGQPVQGGIIKSRSRPRTALDQTNPSSNLLSSNSVALPTKPRLIFPLTRVRRSMTFPS